MFIQELWSHGVSSVSTFIGKPSGQRIMYLPFLPHICVYTSTKPIFFSLFIIIKKTFLNFFKYSYL